MKSESFERIRYVHEMIFPRIKRFQGKITEEQLLRIWNRKTIEEVYKEMPKEEIEFVEEWLRNGGDKEFLINKMRADFMELSPEELSDTILQFVKQANGIDYLVKAVPDVNFLLDNLDKVPLLNLYTFVSNFTFEQLSQYINAKGKNSDILLRAVAKEFSKVGDENNKKAQVQFIESIDSDLDRAKLLIYGGKLSFLPYVNDLFYRNQVIKMKSTLHFKEEDLLKEIDEYDGHLKKALDIEDERERAEYISTIDNNEMKEALLFKLIKKKENRRIVIDSFTRTVDPEIAKVDELARTMILEFFEDRLGEELTDEMRETLDIVLKKTNIMYGELKNDSTGYACYVDKNITIKENLKGNIQDVLGIIIHEYSHMFSNFGYSYTGDAAFRVLEEGMADLFAELVINHYQNKHNDIIMDGKKIKFAKPYVKPSIYDRENAWPRTMLAGLVSSGKDIKALGEYLLGSKNKFADMVLGEEVARKKSRTKFGIIQMKYTRWELYHSPTLDYSNIDENSIYYRRNWLLPAFLIQNRIKIDCISGLGVGNSYDARIIADSYFEGKKFYEVPKDKFTEFIELLRKQCLPNKNFGVIGLISEYKDHLMSSLNEDEIKHFSFEILERIAVIWQGNIRAGRRLESVMKIAFEEEKRKIREGQSVEETKRKLEIVMQELRGRFSKETDNNKKINDYINDYCLAATEAVKGHDEPGRQDLGEQKRQEENRQDGEQEVREEGERKVQQKGGQEVRENVEPEVREKGEQEGGSTAVTVDEIGRATSKTTYGKKKEAGAKLKGDGPKMARGDNGNRTDLDEVRPQ